MASSYQLRSRSRRTRAEGEGEPNERTPLLKKVSLNNLSFLFHDNMVCTEYGNGIYKHIVLVLSPFNRYMSTLCNNRSFLSVLFALVSFFLNFFFALLISFLWRHVIIKPTKGNGKVKSCKAQLR